MKKGKNKKAIVALLSLLFLLLISGRQMQPPILHAQQAILSVATEAPVQADGQIKLLLYANLPTNMQAYEIVLFFDHAALSYDDFISEAEEGVHFTLSAEGDSINIQAQADEGYMIPQGERLIGALHFSAKSAGSSQIVIQRSSFYSLSGDLVPSTLLLTQQIDIAELTSPATESTTTKSESRSSVSEKASSSTPKTSLSQTATLSSDASRSQSSIRTAAETKPLKSEDEAFISALLKIILGAIIIALCVVLIILLIRRRRRY